MSRARAIEALARIASLRQAVAQIEAEREAALAPHRRRYERATAEILAESTSLCAPWHGELQELEAAVSDYLLNDLRPDGTYKQMQLSGLGDNNQLCIAEVCVRPRRVIDPRRWFETIKERTEQFWECVSVGIQKADKNYGKANVDKLAIVESTASVSFKLEPAPIAEELEEAA